MVFCGLYPIDGDDLPDLRDSLEKLKLNDSSFTFEPESSHALGFGFRCGFLGLLHMEIITQRLDREFNLAIIATAPSVVYRAFMTDGTEKQVDNPAFMPDFLRRLSEAGPLCGLVQGQRLGRKDTGFKRFQSKVANAVRSWALRDATRDTGCGFKCFRRETYLALPYFDALHRFMPALVRREGYTLAHVDVIDRPRHAGVSNYGFFDRLWVGILDLMGVRWLIRRRKRVPAASEVSGS